MSHVRITAAMFLAVVLICFASAQQVPATTADPSTTPVVLGPIQTSQHGGALEIRVAAKGVTPHKMLMKDPDRIVLDFRSADFAAGNQRIAVNEGGVLQIRASQFQADPPVARIVIDLSKPVPSHLETQGDDVVLRIGSSSTEIKPSTASAKPSAAVPSKSAAVSASTTPPGPAEKAKTQPEIQSVALGSGKSELAFSVKLTQPVVPKMWIEHEPDRIVMDLPGTVPGNASRRITVGEGPVQTVRLSLYQDNPPVTRIVFDVASGTSKPVLQANGNDLLITFPNSRGTTPLATGTASIPQKAPPTRESSKLVAASQRSVMQESVRPAATQRAVAVPAARHPAPTPEAKQSAQQQQIPSEMAPNPPNIRYANGLLSIDAQNSVLTDILFEVGTKTGAEIQMPPWSDAGRERVVVKLGPGNPRDVIAALLHGSSFNYVIVESPQGLQQLILTPKVDWPNGQNQPPAAADAPTANAPEETPMQGPGGEAASEPPPPEPPQR